MVIKTTLTLAIAYAKKMFAQYRSQAPDYVVTDAERLIASLERWRQSL